MIEREQIKSVVKAKLESALKDGQISLSEEIDLSNTEFYKCNGLLNQKMVLEAKREGKKVIKLAPKTIVTPSARDACNMYSIKLLLEANSQDEDKKKTWRPVRIAIGADHGGLELKEKIKEFLTSRELALFDFGTYHKESVDYPDFAYKVADAVSKGECDCGIMVDSAGIGSSMAANKVEGIRAAFCHNNQEVLNAREHNNANVLTLGGKNLDEREAKEMLVTWLNTQFAGGRHGRRVDKIMKIEKIR